MEPIAAFGELMHRPDPPLDEALFLVSSALGPPLDLIGQLARLDELAAACESPTVEGVLRHLFQGPAAFRGDRSTYDDPQNSRLDRVVDRRRGLPITLAAVAMEVGRRLGVTLVGVGMPGHFLVARIEPSGERPWRWFDCFDGGRELDADGCRDLYQQVSGGDRRFDSQWLEAVGTRQIVIRVLTNLKAAARRRGDMELLRRVMRLRMTLSELALAEDDEMARLMAPYN